ncbi:19333_t:CDS:2, partial [Gigaspora rosea]
MTVSKSSQVQELSRARIRIINLQNKSINDIVKIVARTLLIMSLSPNDLILSGILDVPTLKSEKPPIMK